MEHNLNDWKQTVKFVNNIPIFDTSPLKWLNSDGNRLSPEELIELGYWGVRPAVVPLGYNPEINKLEEVDLKECEKDDDKKIIILSYKIIDLTDNEISGIQRKKRDILLQRTDKFVYPDIWEDLPPERKDIIKSYRKDLRDITLQEGFPRDIKWPDESLLFSLNEEINIINGEDITPSFGDFEPDA